MDTVVIVVVMIEVNDKMKGNVEMMTKRSIRGAIKEVN